MSMIGRCKEILLEVFGHSGYKGQQQDIVAAAVSGKDVFVLAPTGMGKSLCFQIPAIAAPDGITIVVSPLLSLMKNQVSNLRKKDIPAVAYTSETPQDLKQAVVVDLSSGDPSNRILYITPEGLCNTSFMALLQGLYDDGKLNRLIVDEAHCISEWGHDFREDYRNLGIFRQRFKDVPIMALTATATPAVQADIIRSLKMSRANLFEAVHPFNRSNLFYEVRYTGTPDAAKQMGDVCEYISTLHRRRGRASSGIIYCRTRNTCNELSSYLRSKGLNAKPYHRGIPTATLDRTLTDWTNGGDGVIGGVDVVVATIAFGLGIDKGDVRYIIHYDLPKSLEGFYQETGRAGRDGLPAKCVLYYSREDAISVRSWVSKTHSHRATISDVRNGPEPSQRTLDSLGALVDFAERADICRHVSICRYLGETIDTDDAGVARSYCESMCDVCKYPEKTRRRKHKLTPQEIANSRTPASNPPPGDHTKSDQSRKVGGRVEGAWSKNSEQFDSDSRPFAKRPSDVSEDRGNAKKPKVSFAPPLVTKPFSSATSLKKPFKTPFMTRPVSVQVSMPVPSPPLPSPPYLPEEPEEEIAIDDEDDVSVSSPAPYESPVEGDSRDESSSGTPYEEIELDAMFSTKIENSLRQDSVSRVHRALRKALSTDDGEGWTRLAGPEDPEKRSAVITSAVRELEFSAFSLSSTADGYALRMKVYSEAGKLLAQHSAWSDDENDDLDEVRDVVQALIRAQDA